MLKPIKLLLMLMLQWCMARPLVPLLESPRRSTASHRLVQQRFSPGLILMDHQQLCE